MTEAEQGERRKSFVTDLTDVRAVVDALALLFSESEIEVEFDEVIIHDTYYDYHILFKDPEVLTDIAPELYETLSTYLGTRNVLIKAPVEGTTNMLCLTIVEDSPPNPPRLIDRIIDLFSGDPYR